MSMTWFSGGRSLTKEEQNNLRVELERWQTPLEMKNVLTKIEGICSDGSITMSGVSTMYRDGYMARVAATSLKATRVRLCSECRPDFELEGAVSACSRFEATEADKIGRKRGDEFKRDHERFQKGDYYYDYEPPEQVLATAPERLAAAALRKAAAHYDPSWALVIYLNTSSGERLRREIVNTFAPATESAGRMFREVHVLWDNTMYLVWRDGHQELPELQE
jgi:hypothetical protein